KPPMRRGLVGAGLVIVLALGTALAALAAATDPVDEADEPATLQATWAAERLLGSADEESQARANLPFTRQLSAGSNVTGSLADSLVASGVPAATTLEALRALGTAIDLERDLRNGDRFRVRYEQTFTL